MGKRGGPRTDIPDVAIDALFGLGYDAARWKMELERQRYTWYPGLKSRIKGRQFLFFKEEIGRLLSAPPIRRTDGTISNSCKSILEVLKGETGERDQRLQDRRLFGPESSNRTLEDKVKNWREEDPSYGFPPAPNHAAQPDTSTEENCSTAWSNQDPHSSDHGHRRGYMAIRSRQDDTEHNMLWTQTAPMNNSTLLGATPGFGHHNNTNPSLSSAADDLPVDYPNTHQHLFAKQNSLTWDHDMAMMNSASGNALGDDGTIPHDQYMPEREIVQPCFETSRAACQTNYASSTPNQSSQSEMERELLALLALSPQYSNIATTSAKVAATRIVLPPTNGQSHIGVTTGLPDEIAGQQQYTNSVTLEGPETETFGNDNPDDRPTPLPGQDTEMPYINDYQPPGNHEMDGECTLQLAEFLRRIMPASQLSRMAKQAAQTHRARRNRHHGRVFRESGLRRKAFHLNSELQRLKKDLKDTTVALEEKDAEILKLSERIQLLEIHSSEKFRQEAGLARQKEAAKKANAHPPLNYFTEDDNENPPKRSRVMISNGPLALKLNASKPSPLSLYPKIRPQAVASDCRDTTRMSRELEAIHRPSSRNHEKTLEPTTKEIVKENKGPKRSITKKISDKFLGKKFEVAPPVPPKDYQASKSLPAPPNDLDIDGDYATKRLTVATMDSGYQSLETTSARNSVGSIK